MRAYLDIHPVTPLVCATLSFLLHYIIAVLCGAGRTFLARSNLGFAANIIFRRNSRFVSTFLVTSRRFSVILGVSRWCSAGLVLVSAPRLQHCMCKWVGHGYSCLTPECGLRRQIRTTVRNSRIRAVVLNYGRQIPQTCARLCFVLVTSLQAIDGCECSFQQRYQQALGHRQIEIPGEAGRYREAPEQTSGRVINGKGG
jgi:hypothetical protein